MVILFGAGHVGGIPKIWKGYNEDQSMYDLAQRKAKYTKSKYGVDAYAMYVTSMKQYQEVEDYLRRLNVTLASFEHSNATGTPINESVNRVVIYRTVKNAGDGVCRAIGLATAKILNTTLSPIQHKKNSTGGDWYGVLGRAMKAGCQDAWLNEHGFHTHPATRQALSDPDIRQQLAEAEVDAMAEYFNWEGTMRRMLKLTSPYMRGDDVTEFQNAVNRIIDYGLVVDGIFGKNSDTAARTLQSFFGLTADGIVGEKTWSAIDAYEEPDTDYEALYRQAQEQIAQQNMVITSLKDQVNGLEQAYNGMKQEADKLHDELNKIADVFNIIRKRADKR